MSFLQKINKLTDSKLWNVFLIIIGITNIVIKNPETDPLWFLLGWFLLIIGSYRLYKRIKLSDSNKKSSIDHLNERYAKGEITKEEYDTINDDLKKSENS